MVILGTTAWVRDDRGRRQRLNVPASGIKTVLEAISAYWSDPWSFEGSLRSLNREKSHPGARLPGAR